jgi:hypothetical protein
MRVHRNPTVKVDADRDQTATVKVEANPDLITSVAETTGRVAAKVSNVIGSLTSAIKSRRKG